MIDVVFWEKVADNWMKKTDGICIPDLDGAADDAAKIDVEDTSFDNISDDEIDDILADLGLDDI